MTLPRPRLVLAALAATIAALIAGVSLLPYQFPPPRTLPGASAEIGFNNAVAYAVYLALVPLAGLLLARLLPLAGGGAGPSPRAFWRGRSWWLFGVVALGHVALFAAAYLFRGRFHGADATYFQLMLHRLDMGETAYLDFAFHYGPLMLYPARWLEAFFPLELAYAVTLTVTYVLSLAMLFVLLRVLLPSERTAVFWFLLVAVAFFSPLLAPNMTMLRYLLPTATLLLAFSAMSLGGLPRLAGAALILGVALTYSFEGAVLAASATAAVLLLLLLRPSLVAACSSLRGFIWSGAARLDLGGRMHEATRASVWRRSAVLVSALVVPVVAFLLIDPSGQALSIYPRTATAISSGADNLPIYPSLPFLSMLGLTVLASAMALRLITRDPGDGAVPLVVGLMALGLISQRGAFGIAEPTRMAAYSLPMLLLLLYATSRLYGRAHLPRWIVALPLLVGLGLPTQYYHVSLYSGFFARFLPAIPAELVPLGGGYVPSRTVEGFLADVVRQVGPEHAYFMPELEIDGFAVYRQFRLRMPTYESSVYTALTNDDLDRLTSELRTSGAVLVMRRIDIEGAPRVAETPAHPLDVILGTLTPGSHLVPIGEAARARAYAPFFEFVRAEYREVHEVDGIVALVRRD